MNRPNYLYVRVHNRGTAEAQADRFTVETRRCDPGTGMTWPDHFKVISKEMINVPIPPGGSVRVGPFPWTPTIPDHECLIAVVDGSTTPPSSPPRVRRCRTTASYASTTTWASATCTRRSPSSAARPE